MLRNTCTRNLMLFTASLSIVLDAGSNASADVYPVTTSGRARAYALTFPNPFPNWNQESYFGSTGDFAANAYQFDSTQPTSNPYITCEVTGSSTGHVDEIGDVGNATLMTHWVATNQFPLPNTQSGVFESDNFFMYSFITDTHGWITIDVTSTSNLPNVVPLDPQNHCNYAMAINHTVTFNGTWTELLLNDHQTLVYEIFPGFHQLLLERHPNSGITPWPNCDATSTTEMTFTIVTDPLPDPIPGDLNCDQDVDLDDVPAMTMALLDPFLYPEFYGCMENGDLTLDGLVDGADLQGFVNLLVGT